MGLFYGGGGGGSGAVDSVNSQTGTVVLDTDDVSEGSTNVYFTTGRASSAAPVQTVAGRTGTIVIANTDVTGLGNASTKTVGAANGVAGLDGSGKLPSAQLPASVVGAVVYQGTWNATTNSPTLADGVGTKGQYYKVSVAGTTSVDGNAAWGVGDWIIFNGTVWDWVQGNANEVLSVAGRTGAITLATGDISGFSSGVQTVRLDQMTAPQADVSFNGFKATNLGTPSTSSDASTKNYVDTTAVLIATSYSNPPFVNTLAGSKITGNIAGNAANITGTVAIANGGTGATTASSARTALGLDTAATHPATDFDAAGLAAIAAALSIPMSTVTTAGDLIVATGSAAVTRLAKGTDTHVLTVTAGAVGWASPSGGGGSPGGATGALQWNNAESFDGATFTTNDGTDFISPDFGFGAKLQNFVANSTASSWNNGSQTNASSITTNYLAPDGSNSAFHATFAPAQYVYPGIGGHNEGAYDYVLSVWLKGDTGGEAVQLTDGSSANTSSVTLTPSWVRYQFTFTGPNGGDVELYVISTGSASFAVWGAQIEEGATLAGPYIATNGSPIITYGVAVSNLVVNTGAVISPAFSGVFYGDGSNLTNLVSANLTGSLPAVDGSALTGLVYSQLGGTPVNPFDQTLNTTSQATFHSVLFPPEGTTATLVSDQLNVGSFPTGAGGVFVAQFMHGTTNVYQFGDGVSGNYKNGLVYAGSFFGDGSALTGLLYSQLGGTAPGAGALPYTPATSASWAGDPTTVAEAIDRIAARVAAIGLLAIP